MTVVRHTQTLRPIQRIGFGIDEREKASLVVEDLNPRVTPVGDDDDVGLGINGDSRGSVELAVAFTARAEGKEKGAVGGVKDFDAVIVIVGDEDVIGQRINNQKLRRGKLVFGSTTFTESEGLEEGERGGEER